MFQRMFRLEEVLDKLRLCKYLLPQVLVNDEQDKGHRGDRGKEVLIRLCGA
jgi:hypothetical protein